MMRAVVAMWGARGQADVDDDADVRAAEESRRAQRSAFLAALQSERAGVEFRLGQARLNAARLADLAMPERSDEAARLLIERAEASALVDRLTRRLVHVDEQLVRARKEA